jgi:hypothetical protein
MHTNDKISTKERKKDFILLFISFYFEVYKQRKRRKKQIGKCHSRGITPKIH